MNLAFRPLKCQLYIPSLSNLISNLIYLNLNSAIIITRTYLCEYPFIGFIEWEVKKIKAIGI